MSGERYIQESTKLRGNGYPEQAIACIVNNIEQITPDLRATAWNEARFAAEELGDELRAKSFKNKSQALYYPKENGSNIVEKHLRANNG